MDSGDDEAEPCSGFYFGKSAAFEEGEVGGGPCGGIFAADEVPILTSDQDRSQDAFCLVVIYGEIAARGIDGEACPVVENIGEGFVHRAGLIIAQQCVGAGAVDAIKNRAGVELASSLAFGVVDMLRVTLDTIQFTDAVVYIFGDEVALFCRDDKATACVDLSSRGE